MPYFTHTKQGMAKGTPCSFFKDYIWILFEVWGCCLISSGSFKTVIMLKLGDKGKAVRELQEKLNKALVGKIVPLDEDGHFGELTELLVKSFQAETKGAIDGIAGPKTMQALNEAIEAVKPKAVDDLAKRLKCHLIGMSASLDSDRQRGFKMTEQPIIDYSQGWTSVMHQLAIYFNVEVSQRYQRVLKNEKWLTWCNIAVYDWLSKLWPYLPHFDFDEETKKKIIAGATIKPVYGKNVRELSANMTYDWLREDGKKYHGWHEVDTAEQLQYLVDQGHIGVICAQQWNRRRSGHITMVLPLTKEFIQKGFDVLQNQAGLINKMFFESDWYKADKYKPRKKGGSGGVGFFVNYQPK